MKGFFTVNELAASVIPSRLSIPTLPTSRNVLRSAHNYDRNIPMRDEPINIKAFKLALGFTQEDLARKLGVTLPTVSKWEQGLFSPCRLAREKIKKLMKGEKKK